MLGRGVHDRVSPVAALTFHLLHIRQFVDLSLESGCPAMHTQETFTAKLRRHRERSGVSLDEIASTTRIKRELLEAFERNDLSAWPRGLYARAWVRAYACAIGFDPIETVDEFCRLFPHGDRRARRTMQEVASIAAVPFTYRDDVEHRPDGDRRAPSGSLPLPPAPLRDRISRAMRTLSTDTIDHLIQRLREVPIRVARLLRGRA